MEATLSHREEERQKRRSSILSILLYLLFLILLVIPVFTYEVPPPEKDGVLVSFGSPNTGSGDSNPQVQKEIKTTETESSASASESPVETEEKEEKKTVKKEVPTAKLTSPVEQEVVVPKKPEKSAAEIEREKQEEAQRQHQLEKAAREAEAKAAAEKAAKFEESKKQFGEFLSGSGKGNTGTPGNQGDPAGDPNADLLTGISTGSGRIGGGLSNRGVVHEPDVRDNSQKTGKVVMKVCVDSDGYVTESDFTQRGSTTVDGELLRIAKEAADKYRFTESDIEEQCGVITFEFKVE